MNVPFLGGLSAAATPRGLAETPRLFLAPARLVVAGLVALTILCADCAREPLRPDIVLVILDTVRSDFTGPGGREGLTRHLDQLADQGTAFSNAWATAPWTLPSHASIFTGMLSSAHGCHINSWHLSEEHPTLAGMLSEAGYETCAFFSNPWLSDRLTGVLRGFQSRWEFPLGGPHGMTIGRGDQGGPSINAGISQWLKRRDADRPFFLFVNYLEAHLPYDPPPGYREAHLPDLSEDDLVSIAWAAEFNAGLHPSESVDWERVRGLYGGDVHTADALLGDLVSMLKEEGLYDECVLIVTSDHGENLGDHGLIEHQFSVHETLLSVPLVVRAPGRLEEGVREDPVMLTDLYDAVLDFAGVARGDPPPHSRSFVVEGNELSSDVGAPADPDRLLFAEYGGGHKSLVENLRGLNPRLDTGVFGRAYKTVRRGRYRLTVASDGAYWLYDLSVDPDQELNVAAEHPKIVKELNEELLRSKGGAMGSGGEQEHPDEETADKLRALGYIR